MKVSVKEINQLVADIRAGNPPKVPDGKFENIYLDHQTLRGFGIRVIKTGSAFWYCAYTRFGRTHKVTIGDVRTLDRTMAVEATRDLLAKIRLEILDPQKAKAEAMRTAKVTLETVVPRYLARQKEKGIRPATMRYLELYLTGYYFQPLHKLPLDEITSEQISTQIDCIRDRSGKEAAITCHETMSGFFTWAAKTGKVSRSHPNPLKTVEKPVRNKSRERVLTDDEIRLIWKTCEKWEADVLEEREYLARTGQRLRGGKPANINYPRIIQMLFLTGCRKQEIGDLQWSELDLENRQMCIPPERMKNKLELFRPMSEMELEILRKIEEQPGNPYVFGQSDKGQHLSRASEKIVRRVGGEESSLGSG